MIKACDLNADVEMLPDGIDTEVQKREQVKYIYIYIYIMKANHLKINNTILII